MKTLPKHRTTPPTTASVNPAPTPGLPEMSMQRAIENINNCARAYRGTADEHDLLRQSMETIANTFNATFQALQEANATIVALEAGLKDDAEKVETSEGVSASMQ